MQIDNVKIRKMTLNDFEEIKDSFETEFDDFWSSSILKNSLLNESSYYLVATYNNIIVGFTGYNIILDEVDIENIVVRKSFRNKKIGTKLFQNLINHIESLPNIKSITLEVSSLNTYAISLYKNFNFKKIGVRKNYYPNHIDALLMRKYL